MIEIKAWFDGRVLYTAEDATTVREAVEEAVRGGANLYGANLYGANLYGANLDGANLDGANLVGANLDGASLVGANLVGASLDGASLVGASLVGASLVRASLVRASLVGASLDGAKGFNKFITDPIYGMLFAPGTITGFKLVKKDGSGPWNGGIVYRVGESYDVPDADTNEYEQCGTGINLATLPWCMREWKPGYRILTTEHIAANIAVIPLGTDGKYRVRHCTVTGEVDLKAIGLVK